MNEQQTWLQATEEKKDPAHELVWVQNGSSTETLSWSADGRPVNLAPKAVQQLPRWVLHLGLKYPGHPENLRELSPGQGAQEYEQAQLRLKKADFQKRQEELKKMEADLKADEAKLKAASKTPPPPPAGPGGPPAGGNPLS